jgi:PAS domain S-box-containing protein
MKKSDNQERTPLMHALLTFSVLFLGVVLLALFYDFSQVDLGGLLFAMAFLCCIFAAKNMYDSKKAELETEEIKKSLVKELAMSSDQLYIQLYKNSPVPYLIIDLDGIVKSANTSAFRLFGKNQNTIKGLPVFDNIECEEDNHLQFLIDKYRKGVSVSDEMVKVKKPDHREAWALMSLFSFTDLEGLQVGLLTLVDITKQKKAEDAKSEFVSLASHQLRTPIAGMKWSTELLLMDGPESLNDKQKKYIDRLLISIKRMAVLVDDFLRVSRFELGNFRAEYSTVNLPELFDGVVEELATRVKQKNLTIKTYYSAEIPTLETDENLLRMIVTNLYSNATKYTRENGTIHIGYSRKDGDIVISVADNGMGIPEADQEQIFSKLYRATNAVRNVPDGTGLGLYILREAVAVLDGRVEFTSVENEGATFEVFLPLSSSDAEKYGHSQS